MLILFILVINMDFNKMYERVTLVTPLEQRRFFDYYDASVNELCVMFDKKYVFRKGCTYVAPESLNYEDVTREIFHESIIDNILYMAGAGEIYKSEFVRKANLGVKKAWNEHRDEYNATKHEDAVGRVKKMRW